MKSNEIKLRKIENLLEQKEYPFNTFIEYKFKKNYPSKSISHFKLQNTLMIFQNF